MKRRLQQMEEGNEKDEPLYEQKTPANNNEIYNEKLNEKNDENLDENKKTNFRFPIVSDYEIYGWEPQTHHDEYTKDYLQDEIVEEPYEIIPLQQNERWPGRYETNGKVYRAETRREFARIIPPTSNPLPLPFSGGKSERNLHAEPQRIEPYESKHPAEPQEPSYQQQEPVKIEKPKKMRRPFTPTHVPSPIYGLKSSSPISEAMESVIEKKDMKDQELHSQLEDLDEELPLSLITNQQPSEAPLFASSSEKRQPKMTSTEEHTDVIEETVSFASEKEPEDDMVRVEQTEEEPVAEEEVAVHDNDYSETEEIIIEPEESLVVSAVEDVEQTEEATEVKVEVKEPEQLATETKEFVETPEEPIIVPLDEEVEEQDVEEVASEMDDMEEQEEPIKKEKIVPFNVLMLKSDKERLAARVEELLAENAAKKKAVEESFEIETDQVQQPTVEQAEALEQLQPVVEEQQTVIVEPRAEEPEAIAKESQVVVTETVASTSETIVEEPEAETVEEEPPHYGFPTMQYLAPPEEEIIDEEWLASQSETLEDTLSHFAVQATVVQAVQGPAVTMFELTVMQGTKVSKIRNLTDDLKLALAARDIRIQAPIPGTSMIGIEIPNRKTRAVRISEVIDSDAFTNSDSPLEAVLGLSLTGEPQTIDLRKMPHGMIAGATGSGKSVCINSILISLLYKASHHDLKLLLIDPKMVELAPYNGIPHLLSPVITDVKAATAALKWAVNEMERRYELFAHSAVRNIERYNEMVMESRRFSLKMPYILVVIDELADLMMMAPADVEVSISRITQKARACGIHLIIATQRPSVDVITGTIKANIPTRIAFAVSSQVDSRTILDSVGADRLLGKGDMLYLGNGQSAPVRLQGTFVTDDEIERIIEHVRNEAEPNYLFGQDDLLAAAVQEEESDPLFEQACSFVIEQGSASTSSLQRHFSIGYNRAAKLIDRMEANQFISEQRGSRARDVFLTEQAFESFMK